MLQTADEGSKQHDQRQRVRAVDLVNWANQKGSTKQVTVRLTQNEWHNLQTFSNAYLFCIKNCNLYRNYGP